MIAVASSDLLAWEVWCDASGLTQERERERDREISSLPSAPPRDVAHSHGRHGDSLHPCTVHCAACSVGPATEGRTDKWRLDARHASKNYYTTHTLIQQSNTNTLHAHFFSLCLSALCLFLNFLYFIFLIFFFLLRFTESISTTCPIVA